MKQNRFWRRTAKAAAVTALAMTLTSPATFASSGEQTVPGAYTPQDVQVQSGHKAPSHPGSHGKQDVRGPINPQYKMDVTYDSESHTISGKMNVTFKNNLEKTLNQLYFNLWPNAETFDDAGGGIEVDDVEVNGEEASFNVDGTALQISDVSLKKNKPATVEMEFEVSVPEGMDRFGWYEETVSLGNWFPILAVYDEEGWNVDPYYPYGEAFYSLTGDFEVTVTADKSQVIAASGTEIGKPDVRGELATHHYKAKDVRDFALEMNPNYMVKTAKVGHVDINVYYLESQAKHADAMLKSGKKSIALFGEKFGRYPWPELDIVGMKGWFGGMEYPQFVMISFAGEVSDGWVESVTAHEIGHQWFYGIIGNNEYDEPWLDESFATFSAALYNNSLDSLNTEPVSREYFHLSSPVADFTAHMDEGGIGAYYHMIYDYGARTLNDLRERLGNDQFYASMQRYFKLKKFGVSTTGDFIRIMEETSGRDLTEFFNQHRIYVSDQE